MKNKNEQRKLTKKENKNRFRNICASYTQSVIYATWYNPKIHGIASTLHKLESGLAACQVGKLSTGILRLYILYISVCEIYVGC